MCTNMHENEEKACNNGSLFYNMSIDSFVNLKQYFRRRMIMKKKVVSVMLCVAMTAAMMMGCGSKTEEAAAPAET